MPEGLRDRIRIAADQNNRSMNSEIVARLEQSFSAAPQFQLLDPKFIERIDMLYDLLSRETQFGAKMADYLSTVPLKDDTDAD